jgi:hypothetical protein
METRLLVSLVRCIKSLAPNAGKRPKFPSSQTVKDPFTAGTATQSEDQLDIKLQIISS